MTVWMWVVWVVAFVAWWVAFIGMCVGEAGLSESGRLSGEATTDGSSDSATGGPAMGTLWFAIIFQAAVIIHLTYVPLSWSRHLLTSLAHSLTIARSSLPAHRLQLCFILAILVVFAVNGVEYIYQGQTRARAKLDYAGSLKAVGAGWLMLAMVDVSIRTR
jgi:SHO1 osmosensor